ncbi:MAG: hypothetical protein GY811_26350 [Myxococcales bacterium]|nr:hypothetical protein [Myxococcales bacterium]
MASLSYDLVVLGDDFAGLLAATLCASRGMRVLLAETSKATPSYRLGDETVPSAPLVLSGLSRTGVERVTTELNFDHLLRRRLGVRTPPFQFLGPRLRLEVHGEAENFARTLRRETGGDPSWLLGSEMSQAAVESALESTFSMPGTSFWERRELAKRLPQADEAAKSWIGSDSSAPEELSAQLAHLAVSGGSGEDCLARARNLASVLQGLPSFSGESTAWRSIFLEKFQSHSGERRMVVPRGIGTSWGKVTGLETVDDQVRCDHLIAAMPVQRLIPVLGVKAGKRLASLGPLPQAIAYRYTLNLVVHTSGLPEGLSDLSASLLDPGAPPTSGNFALISTRPAHSQGRAIICAEGLAPLDEDGEPNLSGMRECLLAHLQDRMPFLDAHIEVVDSPHEEASPGTVRDLGSALAPEPIWESPPDPHLGLGALPYASGVKQLWIASSQTLPSLGLEGQFIAASSVAKLVSTGKTKSSTKPSVLSAPTG